MDNENDLPPAFVDAINRRKAAVDFLQKHLANLHAAMEVFESLDAAAARTASDNYREALDLYDTAFFVEYENAASPFADAVYAHESHNKTRFDAAIGNLSGARDRFKAAVENARTALENARDIGARPSDFRVLEANAKYDDALDAYAAGFEELGYSLDAIISAFNALG